MIQTAYEAQHMGYAAMEVQSVIVALLRDANLTPIMAVGLLEDIKITLLRGS